MKTSPLGPFSGQPLKWFDQCVSSTPQKGNSYIVHTDGFVYEVKSDHLSKYYRKEEKYKAQIQKLIVEGEKVTKKKIHIEKGFLYFVTKDGVCRAKLP